MFRIVFFQFLFVASLLALIVCNNPEGVQRGSISGKLLYPDSNLVIRVVSGEGVDSTTRDPQSKIFTFDGILYGNCILQIKSKGYGLFEQKLVLDKPLFTCHDIALAQTPPDVAYLDPSNSRVIDSLYFSLESPAITDSTFMISLTFSDKMDTASVEKVLTILPDTVGVKLIWALRASLYMIFPYWKLATIDKIKVSVGRKAITQWGDTLASDYNVFYPVDTTYVRSSRLNK
jgi:hypothetical protein